MDLLFTDLNYNSVENMAGFYFDVRPLIEQYNIKYPENSEEQTATGQEMAL